ncbi:MAG: 16S rRNA (guanine(966)-N(2))-methyltransferase RsmD [Arenicellales bacterium]
MKSGKVRIIGGKWRSRGLAFPNANALRPTPDAVRETVFNWLMPYIHGARCLDLYAGSGALGFEAVSRGAASAVLVEKNPVVVKALKQNQKLIDRGRQIKITSCEGLKYLSTAKASFDLVFLDPPFATDELGKACYQLEKHDLIAPEGLVYMEHASDRDLVYLPDAWQVLKSAQRGGVKYSLYQT